jgi:hypothetical protein
MLLYNIASNCDLFGTEMFRYTESQLYKKFIDVIPIPSRDIQDTRLMKIIQFYARFLTI